MTLNKNYLLTCAEIAPGGGRIYIYELNDIHKKPSYITGPYNNPLLISNNNIAVLKE